MRIALIALLVAAGCGEKKDVGSGSGAAGSGSNASAPPPAPAPKATPPADLPKRSAPGTPEVLAKFDSSCDGGYGPACFDSGMRRAKGMGVARDRVAGVAWLEKGCKLDDAETCGLLAGFIATGDEGVPKDEKRAVELHQKACPRSPASCSVLAAYYHDGLVVAKDLAKSAQLLQQACDAGDGRGCEHLAEDLANGDGMPKDEKHAFEVAQKACTADAYNCETLGAFFIAGTGVAKDAVQGERYVDKACKAGSKKACEGLDILNGR